MSDEDDEQPAKGVTIGTKPVFKETRPTNKNKSKKIKYSLIGILSFATVFSAIILPDSVKLLSIGFVCPLVSQLYYLFRDRSSIETSS